MQFLILERQIAASAESYPEAAVPNGGKVVEGPNLPVEQLYWDGEAIKKRPKRPSDYHAWNPLENKWEQPATLADSLAELPNWQGFLDELRGSDVWAKWFEAAAVNLRANTAATLLLGCLTGTRNLADLDYALQQLEQAMDDDDAVEALSPTEKGWVTRWRKEHNLATP